MVGLIYINTLNFQIEPNAASVVNGYEVRTQDSTEDIPYHSYINAWEKLGVVFRKSLTNRLYFIKESDQPNIEHFLKEVQSDMASFSVFFNFLWFAKDCSAYIKQAGCLYDKSSFILNDNVPYCMADGGIMNIIFSSEELKFAAEIKSAYNRVQKTPKSLKSEAQLGDDKVAIFMKTDFDYNELTRLQRAFGFLTLARSHRELPVKISFYVMILECLFSAIDSAELSHKVAERVALYIEKDREEMMATFSLIKECYNIRSKYVHGQKLDNKHNTNDKLKPKSTELDNVIRKVLTKVIMHDSHLFLQEQNPLDKWLTNLIFTTH